MPLHQFDAPRPVTGWVRPYHRSVIPSTRTSAPVRLRRLADPIAAARAIDIAEAFRDLPGLCLLESARPGRNALDLPDRGSRRRAGVSRGRSGPIRGGAPPGRPAGPGVVVPADAPAFLGGLVGFIGYDLGAVLERLPSIAPADQDLPVLRLALHDWVVAWDRRTGHAWLGGRALDGDGRRLARRLDDVHARLTAWPQRPERRPVFSGPPFLGATGDEPGAPLTFRSSLDRPAYLAGVERVRDHIARGDLYQANLTRRLEAAPQATRGSSTGGCGPATRRSSPPTSTWARAS